MHKENCNGEENNEIPRDLLGGRQSYALHCSTPATRDTAEGSQSIQHPMQQHMPQQKIQKTSLSVQASSSTNNDLLGVTIVVQQILTELSEAVFEEHKIMVLLTEKDYW
jgi:hypothetical protein